MTIQFLLSPKGNGFPCYRIYEQFDCLCLKRNISFVDDGFEPSVFGDDTNCFETDPEDRYHCLVADYRILVERYNGILRKFWNTRDGRPLEDRLKEYASTDVETLREREFSDWLRYLRAEDRELYETVTKDCNH